MRRFNSRRQRFASRGAVVVVPLVAAMLTAIGGAARCQEGRRERVALVRPPGGGIQPEAVLDGRGTLHLVYYRGAPASGDLYYTHRKADRENFSEPIRVNSQPGAAVAEGANRGGQLALGGDGRVHVVWASSEAARLRPTQGGAPLLYTRLNDA
ncbi:MAG TPA: hypothetical protein VK689_17725, partial [Armatimonadota bacterium]|nr:hypothetical protein [Armatimonadota bacterium]